jgi:hypothetical protein
MMFLKKEIFEKKFHQITKLRHKKNYLDSDSSYQKTIWCQNFAEMQKIKNKKVNVLSQYSTLSFSFFLIHQFLEKIHLIRNSDFNLVAFF